MRIPRLLRRPIVWGPVVALALIAILISFVRGPDSDNDSVPFSDVLAFAREGRVERIEAHGGRLEITLRGEDDEIVSRMGSGTDLTEALINEGVTFDPADEGIEVEYKRAQAGPWFALLFNLGIPAIFLVIVYFVVRNAVREGVRRGGVEPSNEPPS